MIAPSPSQSAPQGCPGSDFPLESSYGRSASTSGFPKDSRALRVQNPNSWKLTPQTTENSNVSTCSRSTFAVAAGWLSGRKRPPCKGKDGKPSHEGSNPSPASLGTCRNSNITRSQSLELTRARCYFECPLQGGANRPFSEREIRPHESKRAAPGPPFSIHEGVSPVH